jgi:hypothetical protein
VAAFWITATAVERFLYLIGAPPVDAAQVAQLTQLIVSK